MDRRQRMALLAEAAELDRDGKPALVDGGGPAGIRAVRLPGGGSTNLMRIMQTNACSLSCGYCPTFCGGKVRRTYLTPEEVAQTFMEAQRKGLAHGLFLTSGVPGRAAKMTDRMLAALEILRNKEGFRGYVHVKLLPGSEPAQAEAATRLADRVSVNLEAPTDAHVRRLARDKDLAGDLLPKLEQVGRLFREARATGARGTTTTQFVVGAGGERDRETLGLVARLERDGLLHHAHFSAFQPVAGTPLEGEPATPAVRELRLYQAEHLMRDYGFAFEELAFDADGNLDLDHDPKTAWALAHPERFPVDVTTASYRALIRVPGLGPLVARRLVAARPHAVIRHVGDLRKAGVDVARAAWWLALRGRRLAGAPPAHQLRLFPHGQHLPQAAWRTPVPPCAFR